jgi:hypothetical protein
MSGGHYDYAYYHVQELAEAIEPKTELRKAFKEHMLEVAKACHDIEWVDSGDSSPGDEDAAIRKVLGIKEDKSHGKGLHMG